MYADWLTLVHVDVTCLFVFLYLQNEDVATIDSPTRLHRVAGIMDDTAEKTLNTVSKSADEEFSMDFFKDAVRYL